MQLRTLTFERLPKIVDHCRVTGVFLSDSRFVNFPSLTIELSG